MLECFFEKIVAVEFPVPANNVCPGATSGAYLFYRPAFKNYAEFFDWDAGIKTTIKPPDPQ
jgi:hypothetical protein